MAPSIETIVVIAGLAALAWGISRVQRAELTRIKAQHQDLDIVGIRREVEMLLKRGYHGAYTIFTDEPSDRFVQIRKYIRAPGEFGLETYFPLRPWSEPYYERVQRVLTQCGIAYLKVTVEAGMECLYSDLERDSAKATRMIDAIFREAFGSDDPSVSATWAGISLFDQLVDTPASPGLRAWREFRRHRSLKRHHSQ